MAVSATYFDGKSAGDNPVTVEFDGSSIAISGASVGKIHWPVVGLHAIDPPALGNVFRLTHDGWPGARLVLRDEAFIVSLIERAPQLKGGVSGGDVAKIVAWIVGGLAFVAVASWAVLYLMPDQLAHVMPNSWRIRSGNTIEAAMADGAKRCNTPEGQAALGTVIADLAEGTPDLPAVSVHIYDIPVMNAFAVSGGNIIVTRKLLDLTEAPEELAGVLAHEIGHVNYRHPEAQMIRLTGFQVLISVVTGSNGGTTVTNAAFLAALLQHNRAMEAQADEYARTALVNASIDPMGLKTFFEKILKIEKDKGVGTGPFAALGSIFANHPGTEDRIKLIEPLPAGKVAKPPMTAEQWQALKKICG
jgi:predicted Zn-dependent protease